MRKQILPLISALVLALNGRESVAQTNAFTYQGRLTVDGSPANGNYDLTFLLFDGATGGSQVNSIITNANQTVSNGLFIVTLNFGADAFQGADRWLQIGVRTNGSGGAFTSLSPRQLITPSPYALYTPTAATAATATMANGVAANSITGAGIQNSTITAAKIASGQVVKSLNGLFDSVTLSAGANVTLTSSGNNLQLAANDGTRWSLIGNAGTTAGANFVGTTDNQPLELRVNSARALRLEPTATSPNVIGGYSGNYVSNGLAAATIGGGGTPPNPNRITASFATIAGGYGNTASGLQAFIGGGQMNVAAGGSDVIGGGSGNFIGNFVSPGNATIGGGGGNTNNGYGATIAGGINNTIGSPNYANGYETIGGGENNTASVSDATIGGGKFNTASGMFSFIGSGSNNVAAGQSSAIAGGERNFATYESAVAGGYHNSASGNYSSVGGGYYNSASGTNSTVGGGAGNTVNGDEGTIAGGLDNVAGESSTVGGGALNNASGVFATIPGGSQNTASGELSFAAGNQANAIHQGAFVWGDSTAANVYSTAANQFTVRASGGARFFSNAGATTGVSLAPGGGSWSTLSDRDAKEHFAAVDGREILDRVAALPVSVWNYKSQAPSVRHIGPMAQDFAEAFGVGEDDRHITTVDESGVALAAIQGLNQKLEMEVRAKDAEITDLKTRLEKLEQLINTKAGETK